MTGTSHLRPQVVLSRTDLPSPACKRQKQTLLRPFHRHLSGQPLVTSTECGQAPFALKTSPYTMQFLRAQVRECYSGQLQPWAVGSIWYTVYWKRSGQILGVFCLGVLFCFLVSSFAYSCQKKKRLLYHVLTLPLPCSFPSLAARTYSPPQALPDAFPQRRIYIVKSGQCSTQSSEMGKQTSPSIQLPSMGHLLFPGAAQSNNLQGTMLLGKSMKTHETGPLNMEGLPSILLATPCVQPVKDTLSYIKTPAWDNGRLCSAPHFSSKPCSGVPEWEADRQGLPFSAGTEFTKLC